MIHSQVSFIRTKFAELKKKLHSQQTSFPKEANKLCVAVKASYVVSHTVKVKQTTDGQCVKVCMVAASEPMYKQLLSFHYLPENFIFWDTLRCIVLLQVNVCLLFGMPVVYQVCNVDVRDVLWNSCYFIQGLDHVCTDIWCNVSSIRF